MKIRATMSGSSGLEGLPEALTAEVALHIQSAGRGIVDQYRAGVPIDEGELYGSIDGEVSPTGLSVRVGADAPHARFVEFGTSDTPAVPALFPAFQRNVRVLRKNLRDLLKGSGFRMRSRVVRIKSTR